MESETALPRTIATGPDERTTTGVLGPEAHPRTDAFRSFVNGVLDVPEHGQEVVVTTHVWTVEELVLTKHATERVEVVRDTLRRVEVDVDAVGPGRHA